VVCAFRIIFQQLTVRLFQLCPQVATDYDKEFLLRVAVRDDCEADLDLYLPHSTVDQVVAAFRAMTDNKSPEGRLRPLIDAQCGPLLMVLNQDVMGISPSDDKVKRLKKGTTSRNAGSRQSSVETRNW